MSKDFYKNKHIFNLSECPEISYDEIHKKVIGKMKDETKGAPIFEFVES